MRQMDFQKIKSKLESFCAYQERSLYEVEKKHLDISNEYINNKKYYPGFFIIFLKKKSI